MLDVFISLVMFSLFLCEKLVSQCILQDSPYSKTVLKEKAKF